MASRSSSIITPIAVVAAFVGLALWASSPQVFVPPQATMLRGAGLASAASVALPLAAQAADFDPVPDMGSSVGLAGLLEPIMIGMTMGLVPLSIFGLLVAAWLQFKKGPTLGL
mmetsp:Transcript_55735/g.119955  ORF Transcript_55735/g.119955 Transcript_55735/m.119955 type:complete len:113 (+) Transcript_55735:71-409(+)